MLRKLLLITATAAVTFSLSAFALGLGEAEVNSVLGEPLDARIVLLSAAEEDAEQMSVALASPARFEQAGLPWTPLVNQLLFELERDAAGELQIRVKTKVPVKEPFLDFMVELNWSNGRLVREYTLLLDPPVLMPVEIAAAPQPPAVVPAAPARVAATSAPAGFGLKSWTVRRGDTLWVIAKRVRPDPSLSVHQVMSGLQRANPDAFIGGNINRLKAGVVLRVPDAAELATRSRASARAETNRQASEWRDSGTAKASVPQAEPAPAEKPAVPEAPRVKLVVPAQEEVDAALAVAEGSADSEAATTDAASLVLAEENAALRLKVDDLEEQLTRLQEEMSRLLMLQDSDLAALQAGLREASADQQAFVEEPPAADDHAAADDHQAADDDQAAPAADSGPLGAVRRFLSPYLPPNLFEDPWLIGGGGAIVLLLLLALISRRRRAAGGDADEASAAVPADRAPPQPVAAPSQPVAAAAPIADSHEDVFGDFMTSDKIDTADTSSDPLGEADVYLAYGRSREAEELLLRALEAEPGNRDYQLKLLDVYHGTHDREAFVRQLEMLEQDLAGGGPQWDHALQLASEIAPDHRLVAEGVPSSGDEETLEAVGNLDIDLDFEPVFGEEQATEEAPLDIAEEFGKQAPAAVDEAAPDAKSALEPFDDALDFTAEFEIGSLADDEAALGAAGDLDFELPGEGAAPAGDLPETVAEEAVAPVGEEPALDVEGDLDFELPEEGATLAAEEPALDVPVEDEALTSLGLGEELEAVGEGFGDEMVANKLELARAYIDMEDWEGAREILAEVIDEGSEAQQQQAQELLASCS